MRSESFTLEGVTYYAEKRACGRPGCKCQDGELHGPYWYQRNPAGIVSYIGKELPIDVTAARAVLPHASADIEARCAVLRLEIRHLTEDLDALCRLRNYQALSDRDRRIIEAEGFGYCLVSAAVHQVDQDGLVSESPDRSYQDQDRGELCVTCQ